MRIDVALQGLVRGLQILCFQLDVGFTTVAAFGQMFFDLGSDWGFGFPFDIAGECGDDLTA